MLKTLAQNLKDTCLNYAKRALFIIAALALLASIVAADCARRTIWAGHRVYGGRQYDDFVSCGGSAGNFGYTCAEDGNCYVNPNLTEEANQICGCTGGGSDTPALEESRQ